MLNYIGKRLGQSAFIVFLVSFLVFILLRVMISDPTRLIVGGMASDEVVEQVATEMGLREPILMQYTHYLGGLAQGDLGKSYVRSKVNETQTIDSLSEQSFFSNKESIFSLIVGALPYTLSLACIALFLALVVSFIIGVSAGLNPGKWQDKLAFAIGSCCVSIPNFWLGIVLILLISVKLQWLPSIGYKNINYVWLPAIVLAVELIPMISRTLSVSVAGIKNQSFINTGKVRGLSPRRIIYAHIIRNASIPLLNLLGIQFSALIGGTLVIEYIFDYPGLGLLTIQAVTQRDFPLIQGIVIVTSLIFVCMNILVDCIATLIDPRLGDK